MNKTLSFKKRHKSSKMKQSRSALKLIHNIIEHSEYYDSCCQKGETRPALSDYNSNSGSRYPSLSYWKHIRQVGY